MEAKQGRESSFIAYLRKLAADQDRGALAALRSGLGHRPGTAAPMHRYVAPFLDPNRPFDDDRFYLIASLFAWHSQTADEGNLGDHFRRIKQESDSIEKRFVALLACHRDDLPNHLRQAIGLLGSKDVPVNWEQLLRDLAHWDHPDRFVQRRWAKSFYRGQADSTAPAPEAGTD